MFFPSKTIEATPAEIELKYEEVSFSTADGVILHAWWIPHLHARATLLFSHGNAGNISHRLEKLRIFHDLGLNVFMYDYRGYGQSGGSPDEVGLYADAQAAYHHLVKIKKILARQIIAYGESLGGAVSTNLAEKSEIGALILDSAFTSVRDLAKVHYPFLAPLARTQFDALSMVSGVRAPILVLHSPQDEIVPYLQGQRLFAAAGEPKQFVELRGDHNGGFLISGEVYVEGIRKFLETHFPVPKS